MVPLSLKYEFTHFDLSSEANKKTQQDYFKWFIQTTPLLSSKDVDLNRNITQIIIESQRL